MGLPAPRVGRQGDHKPRKGPQEMQPLILSLPGNITFRAVPSVDSAQGTPVRISPFCMPGMS